MSIDPGSLPRRYQDQVAAQLYKPGSLTAQQKPTAKARLRQKAGDGLNKTERAFLGHLKRQDCGARVYAQSITLKLGNGVRYTPDFVAVAPGDYFHAYEVKGFMRDDAAVKLKVAASTYRWIKFHLVTKRKGGGWDIQAVLP